MASFSCFISVLFIALSFSATEAALSAVPKGHLASSSEPANNAYCPQGHLASSSEPANNAYYTQGHLASSSEPANNAYNSNPFYNSIDSLLLPTTSYIEALSFFTLFLGVKACMYHY
ncbi:hypothetical protein OIU85_008376 [Salix viminalis]|uniref:Uncharacterized protein n=1 Tax=Salix viminalis TaxID=40686 RepID=A0A9Q0SI19_SALVM|nr:hypothetical protein OIU85_008376 [Salix viminalis]